MIITKVVKLLTAGIFGDPLDIVRQTIYIKMLAIELTALLFAKIH
jgi:hypothetical protein